MNPSACPCHALQPDFRLVVDRPLSERPRQNKWILGAWLVLVLLGILNMVDKARAEAYSTYCGWGKCQCGGVIWGPCHVWRLDVGPQPCHVWRLDVGPVPFGTLPVLCKG